MGQVLRSSERNHGAGGDLQAKGTKRVGPGPQGLYQFQVRRTKGNGQFPVLACRVEYRVHPHQQASAAREVVSCLAVGYQDLTLIDRFAVLRLRPVNTRFSWSTV